MIVLHICAVRLRAVCINFFCRIFWTFSWFFIQHGPTEEAQWGCI